MVSFTPRPLLPPGNGLPVPNRTETWWIPVPVWTLTRRISPHDGNGSPDTLHSSPQPVAIPTELSRLLYSTNIRFPFPPRRDYRSQFVSIGWSSVSIYHTFKMSQEIASTGTHKVTVQTETNSMVWVRERTIPTERPPLVGEVIANFFCG
jgi:hypothetical protein